MRKWIMLILGIFSICILGTSGYPSVVRYGVGARALGMGNAFTGFSDDISSVYWNPAGLDQLENRTFFAQYDELKLDRRYQFISLGLPHALGGTVAFSWQNQWDGMIPNYDSTGSLLSYFESRDNTYMFTYGNQITKWMAVGMNLKYRYIEPYDSYTADGFGVDLGMLFTMSEKWSCGFNVKDISSSLRWEGAVKNSVEDIPVHYLAGIAYRPIPEVIFDLDFSKISHEDAKTRFGVEVWLRNIVGLRAGTDDGKLSLGASLKLKKWVVDYAYKRGELEDISRIAATVNFDGIGQGLANTFKSKREKILRDRHRKNRQVEYKDKVKVVAVKRTSPIQKKEIILGHGRKIVTKSTIGPTHEQAKIISETGAPRLSEIEIKKVEPVIDITGNRVVDLSNKSIKVKNVVSNVNTPNTVVHNEKILQNGNSVAAEKYIQNSLKLYNKGEYDKSLEDVLTAIRLDPYNGEAYFMSSKIYRKQNKYDKAVSSLKQAIMLSPEKQNYYLTLGNIYDKIGQKNKAVMEFQKAIDIDPNSRYARLAKRMLQFMSN